MKKSIFIYGILFPILGFSQNVGIGTTAPQQVVHIDAQKNNNNAAPTPTQAQDDVVFTNQGYVGVGTITPIARLDVRGTGAKNAIAIGTSSQTASNAGAGAIRYVNNGTSWGIEYSNGTNWIFLPTSPVKALVYAGKNTTQNISASTVTDITDWLELEDTTNSFNPSSGVFTAPVTGDYIVSLNLVTNSTSIAADSNTETIISTNSSNGVPEFRCVNAYPGSSSANNNTGNTCTAIFRLNAGETITPQFWQNINSSVSLIGDQISNTLTISQL